MSRFIFFTKTPWNEPPRLRHQLAQLLVNAGHEVLFAERPYWPGQSKTVGDGAPNGIKLFRHGELLHHKLRIGWLLRWSNAWWTRRSIARAIHKFNPQPDDVIVNFNYEYFFLRDVFPTNKLITIINDDFISTIFCFLKPTLFKAQKATCRTSDAVLTPSPVLQVQLAAYCKPKLFFPWTDIGYRMTASKRDRDTILFWGSINRRIDFPFLERFATELLKTNQQLKILFVGPTERGVKSHPFFLLYPNVKYQGVSKLETLELDRIIGSIIPYVSGVPEVDVIVLPNRLFQLLAHGIPIFITGMPQFIRQPFVFRLDNGEMIAKVLWVRDNFQSLQADIQSFVESNSPNSRLEEFLKIVKSKKNQ